ncbi:MAG: uracil phosphoribosyltransferase [Ignavibacteriales bacterium]|nr:uracil phosphoribosyltransferase [Ignavibacteriales bacterium]MCF8307207.1 uracil phosphoribosyltransferase [Ignavibacteriales bacterium]MCF8315212.1 uracil phosphoribosyltransferase [Ignavibacteriales bacterium]MCF8438487.1 uracil phosphoribosyltransferase [Ignavibacteriales bacterium]
MNNLIIVENPLIKRDITILRDKNTPYELFRIALNRIGYSIAIELSKSLKLTQFTVTTPLEETNGYRLKDSIILIPVLRAGLAMVQSFIELIPDASVGHIGLQRNETTLQPVEYYFKTPSHLPESKVIIIDPMLATGGSASYAIRYLKQKGAANVSLACLIAAPFGVNKITSEHPDVQIYTAALDRELNSSGYILPGLGDAGDRTFGTF